MKIVEEGNSYKYFDVNGKEVHEGDTVICNGNKMKVYLTTDGRLGIDATNPKWIESGRACECEHGIYPFGYYDEIEKINS